MVTYTKQEERSFIKTNKQLARTISYFSQEVSSNYLVDANDERNYLQNIHVNQLKPFVSTDIRPQSHEPENESNGHESEPQNNDDESDYDEVELAVKPILNKKVVKNRSGCRKIFDLVKWDDKDIGPSWEPLSNLHCGELSKTFESSLLVTETN